MRHMIGWMRSRWYIYGINSALGLALQRAWRPRLQLNMNISSKRTLEMAIKLKNAQAIINYQFHDPRILWNALQAAGAGITNAHTHPPSFDDNRRLATVGDAVLGLVLAESSYAKGDARSTNEAPRIPRLPTQTAD